MIKHTSFKIGKLLDTAVNLKNGSPDHSASQITAWNAQATVTMGVS